MISTVVEKDELPNGVVVSTIVCKDGERTWYETTAFIREPEFHASEVWHADDKTQASRNHSRRMLACA
jgi:hypothetical protein